MIETKELKFYKLCEAGEFPKDEMHTADKAVFDTDIRLKQWDGTISSFPLHHVETWLWSPNIEPFAHNACNWEEEYSGVLGFLMRFLLGKTWKGGARLGNNSGEIPDLIIRKGQPLYFGVWYHNMRSVPSDFHAKTTVYFERVV